MIRLCIAAFASLVMLAASTAAQAASADQARPALKSEAIVTGNIVRIGDLVDNAGIVANVPIFRAPDLGSTGSVPIDAVIEALRTNALVGIDTGGLNEVVVVRASRTIPAKEVEDSVAAALSKQYGQSRSHAVLDLFGRDATAGADHHHFV